VTQNKEGIQHTKARLEESLKKKWEGQVMHGQHIRSKYRKLISEEDLFLWLLRGDLKEETESEIITGQGQASQTKYHVTKIITNRNR
jgi:hypothetical protein